MTLPTALPPQIALQMYTVRDQFRTNPSACLADVVAAGFTAVEFAGFADLSPHELRGLLDEQGLRALSSHIDIPEFDDLDRVIAEHQILGCEAVVIQQAATSDFADRESVIRLAARANAWGERLAEAGLRLGYHGYHDFEHEFAIDDGVRRYDRFVELTDPRWVDIQLDSFWVQYVGDDVGQTLRRLAGRVPMLHVKETRADGVGDAPLGTGTTDWFALVRAAMATGVRWLIVEQEKDPAHAPRDIRISRANLSTVLEELAATS